MINKNNRVIILIASLLIKICIGSIYSWSIYAQDLIKNYNFYAFQTQIIFGVAIASFTLTMLFSGKIERKYGPKVTSLIGVFFFISGHITAWLSKGNFIFIILGLGIFFGISIGFCYVSALTTPIKWYPDKKGFISGIAVGGFGFGAIIHSFLVQYLLNRNINIMNIFLIIGLLYGVIILICSLFLSVPKAFTNNTDYNDIKFFELFKDKSIISLSVAMFAGTFSGLLIIGNLKSIQLFNGINEFLAVLSVSIFSIGNSSGRIFWGYLSDKLSRKYLISFNLLFTILLFLLLLFFGRYQLFSLFFSLFIGFVFASNFVLYVSDITYRYGINKLGSIYPYIFLFYGIGGILGPSIGGIIFDMTRNYNYSVLISIIICTLGLPIFFLLYKTENKFLNLKQETIKKNIYEKYLNFK